MRNLACVFLSVLLLAAGLMAADEGKIPITTTSAEAEALFLQARDLQDKFRFLESRPLLEQAMALDSNFALACRDLGNSQTTNKDFTDCLEKAASLAEKVSECERFWILADEAGSHADFPKQREFLGKLVAACPNDERAHNALGIYFYGRQHFDSAAAEFDKATVLNPLFLTPWNMLGYSRRSIGDYPGAEKAFLKFIELNPQDANPYDSYAELLLKMGRYDESVARYREALKIDTTFNVTRFNMAAPLLYAGKRVEARAELMAMVKKARNDADRQLAFFGVAMTHIDEGKYDEALAALNRVGAIASKLNDVAPVVQNVLAIATLQTEYGKFDEALENFDRAVTLMNGSDLSAATKAQTERAAIYGQAHVAVLKGELSYAKALSESHAAKSKAAGTVNAMRAIHELDGLIALAEKQYEKAAAELEQSSLQQANNLYRLALAYEGIGNRAKALAKAAEAANINTLLNVNDVIYRPKAKILTEEWAKK